MNIIEIYNKYHLPDNLQMHMLRVAASSNLIIDNWNGPKIDKEAIIRVCLLHDMGNMVKIPEDFSDDEKFVKIRRKYLEKYGTNDHEINLEIGKLEGDAKIRYKDKPLYVWSNEDKANHLIECALRNRKANYGILHH